MNSAHFQLPTIWEVVSDPSIVRNLIVLTSATDVEDHIKALLHEEEEWGVGVPAAQAFCVHNMKAASVSEWNYPRGIRPGDRLICYSPRLRVTYIDLETKEPVISEIRIPRVITVEEIAFMEPRQQFVMRRVGQEKYLPVDTEMFGRLRAA